VTSHIHGAVSIWKLEKAFNQLQKQYTLTTTTNKWEEKYIILKHEQFP